MERGRRMIGVLEIALAIWFVLAVIICIVFSYCIGNRTSAHVMTMYDLIALYILIYIKYFIILGAVLGVWYLFLII